MRKIVCILLALLTVLFIGGCKSDAKPEQNAEETENTEVFNDGNPFYSDEIGRNTAEKMLPNFVSTGAFGTLNNIHGFKFKYLKDATADGHDCYIYEMYVIKEKGGDYVFYKNVAVDKKGSSAFIYEE